MRGCCRTEEVTESENRQIAGMTVEVTWSICPHLCLSSKRCETLNKQHKFVLLKPVIARSLRRKGSLLWCWPIHVAEEEKSGAQAAWRVTTPAHIVSTSPYVTHETYGSVPYSEIPLMSRLHLSGVHPVTSKLMTVCVWCVFVCLMSCPLQDLM